MEFTYLEYQGLSALSMIDGAESESTGGNCQAVTIGVVGGTIALTQLCEIGGDIGYYAGDDWSETGEGSAYSSLATVSTSLSDHPETPQEILGNIHQIMRAESMLVDSAIDGEIDGETYDRELEELVHLAKVTGVALIANATAVIHAMTKNGGGN
jgi:hypothetical protein